MNCHTANISKYVDYHLQPIVKEIPSYVKDTQDFLKKLEKVKDIPQESLLVTLDIKSLYTNIPNNEGIKAVKESYESYVWTHNKTNVYLPNHEQNSAKRKQQHKIIWFNPPLNLDVSTNVAKIFLNLIEKHFPCSSKLHKIFNKNTIKVSYSCTQNMSQIIKGHDKKIVQKETQETSDCNCRVKTDCPLNGDCRKESVIEK